MPSWGLTSNFAQLVTKLMAFRQRTPVALDISWRVVRLDAKFELHHRVQYEMVHG